MRLPKFLTFVALLIAWMSAAPWAEPGGGHLRLPAAHSAPLSTALDSMPARPAPRGAHVAFAGTSVDVDPEDDQHEGGGAAFATASRHEGRRATPPSADGPPDRRPRAHLPTGPPSA